MVLTIWLIYGSCWIIQKWQKCIFEWSKEPKKRFLTIFWRLVCWIDLIWHIVIVLKCFPSFSSLAMSWRIIQRSRKYIFEMIQRAKRRFLAISWILVCWINLILHILIVLNVFQLFTIALIYKKGVSCLGNRSLIIMISIVIANKGQKWQFWPMVLLCLMYRLDMLTRWKGMKVLLEQVRQDDLL